MKKIFLTLFLISLSLYANIPNTISWQGVVTDSEGNYLNGTYNISVKLFDAHINGNELWGELHSSIEVDNGLVNITLGSIEELDLVFDSQYWLEITVDDGEPLTRIALNSVPYSIYAKRTGGVFEADSLVLKDSEGNTRFVINPETGTFKMLDNDTVWYSMSVNSPLKTRNVFGDGTYTEIHNGKEATFNRDGILLHDRDRTSYDNDNGKSGTNEIKKHYDKDSNVVLEQIYENEWDEDEIVETQTYRYYSDSAKMEGQMIFVRNQDLKNSGNTEIQTRINYNKDGVESSKNIKQFQNGILTKEENYQNGTKINEINYSENKSENSILNPSGTVNRKITKYSDQLKWEVTSGVQSSYQTQNQNSWEYQNSGLSSSFQIQSAENNGYKIGLNSNKPTNPAMEFISDNSGGYMKFNGNTYFDDSLFAESFFNGVNGKFGENLEVEGNMYVKGPYSYKIQHPDDANKYLVHASVESNEVVNMYSGNITTDNDGMATVSLPEYFEDINTEYRYILTVVGSTFSRAIVYNEIENNQFQIKTDEPNIKVSWQVTAKRNDDYMQDNPFEDEIDK